MKVFVFAAFLAVAAAGTSYQQQYPTTYNTEYKGESSYKKSYESPTPYHFAYELKDDYTYNNYNHQESGDDKGYVTGSYSVYLPDGRTQIVNYKADDYTGYVADVKYTGEAKYPEYKTEAYKVAAYPAPAPYKKEYQTPTYSAPAPTYKKEYPVPTYSAPAPTYKKEYPVPTYSAPAPIYKKEHHAPTYFAPAPTYKKEHHAPTY